MQLKCDVKQVSQRAILCFVRCKCSLTQTTSVAKNTVEPHTLQFLWQLLNLRGNNICLENKSISALLMKFQVLDGHKAFQTMLESVNFTGFSPLVQRNNGYKRALYRHVSIAIYITYKHGFAVPILVTVIDTCREVVSHHMSLKRNVRYIMLHSCSMHFESKILYGYAVQYTLRPYALAGLTTGLHK